MHSLKTFDVKNDQISENYKKTSTFLYKTVYYTVQSQYLTLKFKNFISGFFPDFPDPVFSRKLFLQRLADGQTLCQVFAHIYYINYVSSLVWWRKVEHMKNAKNILFLGKEPFLEKNYLTKIVHNWKIKNRKKIFSRNSGSGFLSGFYIFRIFWIFRICSIYEPFLSKNFWIISNGWFMKGYVLHNLPHREIFWKPYHDKYSRLCLTKLLIL